MARIVFAILAVWLVTLIAGAALWPIYESRGILVAIGAGLVGGAVVAGLGARFRHPSWVVMILTALYFVAVGVPVAVPSRALNGIFPTPEGILDLLAGVALGWKQLLTVTLPVGDYEALLVPAFLLVLLSVVIGVSIATRTRVPEASVLPAVIVYIVAVAFGPDDRAASVILPIALLTAVALALIGFRQGRRRAATAALARETDEHPTRDAAGFRALAGGLVLLVLAAGAGVGAASALAPTTARTVLRTAVEQPFDPRDYVSPLSAFRSYWQEDTVDSVLFRVSGQDGELVRLATLDTYDGVVFAVGSAAVTSESGAFVRVPSTFDQSGLEGVDTSTSIEIDQYSGVWVPTVGKLRSIDFEGPDGADLRGAFFYNDTTGTAADLRGLSSGDRYQLDSVVPPSPALSDISDLEPGSAVVPEATGVPEELVTVLEEYVSGVDGPGAQLAAMLDGLAVNGYISHGVTDDEPPSRSGHGSDRLTELLSAPRMIGDGEQYAATAALMARELGFPSRVVLGFVPQDGVVRGGDVVAYVEVDTAQYGWVALDVTPPYRDIPEELPEDNAQVSRPPTIVPPPVVDTEQPDRQETPDSEQELPPDLNPLWGVLLAIATVLGWVLLALAILISPFLVIIVAKARRRRLRRRATLPADRVAGGWREFEDAVLDHGVSTAPSSTRSEVAGVTGVVGAQVLAAVADRATFSPDEPTAEDADVVWRAVDDLRGTLDSGLTRWQRLKARVSLRSLGGYSVTRIFSR
ncbi:transglutaminase-like domain-containing protein [Antiquaquibacter oligotrophicus]|uniref:transglutaminase domain-containing protein n=1 Tax=Antiquaquibacter oligotrophicus TaxID=2880260 RepID=UPI002AC8A1A5|nr:transglutaminase-like domain-containing protein [Antiquaquibacter oligotrophicus]UDF13692.1 transglutaminase-like domain-containing protein [Antiquaquibacter oligotrophicus]